jgi:hypothetical protein
MAKRAQMSPSAKLRLLYETDDFGDWTGFLDSIADRAPESATNIDAILKSIVSPQRAEAIVVAREMEKYGVGKFISGRRGAPSRLEWYFRSDSVGKVARGDLNELVSLATEDEPGDESTADENDAGAEQIMHTFRLRQEETVRFQLPADLTQQEAGRLSEFIKSLPFE